MVSSALSSLTGVSSLWEIYGTQSSTASQLFGTSGSTSSVEDEIQISDRAKQMQQALSLFDSIISPSTGREYKSLSMIESELTEDFSDFTSVLGDFFQMAGIDTGSGLSMQLNGVGGVNVTGADGEKVENLFGNNSQLTSRFALIAAQASLLDAASTVEGFEDAYNEDPPAAVKQYINELEERLLGMQMTVKDGEFDTEFNAA